MSEYPTIMMDFATRLFESEVVYSTTHILRPVMKIVLHKIWKAYTKKKIQGAFLFSNNSSRECVNFVCFFLNVCIWKLYDSTRPIVFRMDSWHGDPCRRGSLEKNFDSIQNCLNQHGLPMCSSTKDLLFFDDLAHTLQKEIPHYVQVPRYQNCTDIEPVLQALKPLAKHFQPDAWKRITRNAMYINVREIVHKKQSEKEKKEDMFLYVGAINDFLSIEGGGHKKNRGNTRKRL